MKIVFIADFFVNQVLGGGELNNEELLKILEDSSHQVIKINSHLVNSQFIKKHHDAKFIIANFINLREDCKKYITDTCDYVIYEHDHKYLTTRNPGVFPDFIAPKEHVINLEFYQNANAVLCQSSFHADIAQKNTELDNIVNLGGNIWDMDSLKFMSEQAKIEKQPTYAIMNSQIKHKNTVGAIRFCNAKGYD